MRDTVPTGTGQGNPEPVDWSPPPRLETHKVRGNRPPAVLGFYFRNQTRGTWKKRTKRHCGRLPFLSRPSHSRGTPREGPSRVLRQPEAIWRPPEAIYGFCIRSWVVFCSEYNEKRKLHSCHNTPTCSGISGTPGAGHPRAVRPPGSRWRAQTKMSGFVSEVGLFFARNTTKNTSYILSTAHLLAHTPRAHPGQVTRAL